MKKSVTGKINFCTLAGDRQNIHFVNFNKNWKEYEDGFGDPNEDFWAGLKLTVLLKGNIANARNFLRFTSAYRV